MVKIQSDAYTQWKNGLIDVTLTTTATLTSIQENIELNSSGGVFTVTLPDITAPTDVMTTGKAIWFYDNGSAGTNNITIITNPSDSTALDNASSFIINRNNMIAKAELINTRWKITITDAGEFNLGSFYINENTTTFTTIDDPNTYTNIGGTATANTLNDNFTLTTGPNVLTYDGTNTIKTLISASMSLSKQLQPFDRVRVGIFLNADATPILGGTALIEINRRTGSLAITNIPLQLVTNDAIKVMIKNLNTTNNILVEDISLTIQETGKF